jgi:prepilin-type N-terminal cleavage/methylation domain-containing protein
MTRAVLRTNRLRAGFTLVELLIVMTIIAMLATIIMFALKNAREMARVQKTEGTILRLDTFFMQRWQDYARRRVPADAIKGKQNPRKARLEALRELMRLEFPERWTEVETDPSQESGIRQRPAASQSHKRRYDDSRDPTGKPSKSHRDTGTYQQAECLYFILTTRMAGLESAREHFQESEIGDVDGDGFLEFLDAWGTPIMFLRWAPGFESPLQPQDAKRNARRPEYHDPFDPTMADPDAYKLYPLIFSAGPDRQYDIHHKATGGSGKMNNPYGDRDMGKPEDNDSYTNAKDGTINSYDNIHNHMPRG